MFANIVAIPEWDIASLVDEDGNIIITFLFQDGEASILA